MRFSIPLGLGSYESASVSFSAQRCINMYCNIAQNQSLDEYALFSTPGIVSFSNVGIHPSRGAIVMNGVYYVVSEQTLYEVSEDGTVTSRGTIEGTGRVSMAHNGEKLCIVVPGFKGYVYVASTTTLTEITDSDYVTADTVHFKDGYYIFTATAGDIFFISALNDPLSFNALDFGTFEQSGDLIKAIHVSQDELFILGTRTTGVFQNIGGADFPFQVVQGASMEKGIHSRYSPIQWDGNFYFIGGGLNEKTSIFKAGGSAEPIRISTDSIEFQIQKFNTSEISNAFSFTYSVNGASFVGFTFRSTNIDSKTFVYNVTASDYAKRNIWFEQQTGVTDNAWRIASLDFVYDKLIVSDSVDGRIGYIDSDASTEYGSTIIREKTTGPFSEDGKETFIKSLELVGNPGQGTTTGQGSDPQVMLSYSDDGSRTWSNEFTRSIGKIGEYFKRAVWRRLGRIPYNRVWKFRVSDPVPVSFIKIDVEV